VDVDIHGLRLHASDGALVDVVALQQVQKQPGPDRAQTEHTLHDNRQLRPAPGREAGELQRPLVTRKAGRPVIARQLDQNADILRSTQPLAQNLGRDLRHPGDRAQRDPFVRHGDRNRIKG
jgi:hypothetical protein